MSKFYCCITLRIIFFVLTVFLFFIIDSYSPIGAGIHEALVQVVSLCYIFTGCATGSVDWWVLHQQTGADRLSSQMDTTLQERGTPCTPIELNTLHDSKLTYCDLCGQIKGAARIVVRVQYDQCWTFNWTSISTVHMYSVDKICVYIGEGLLRRPHPFIQLSSCEKRDCGRGTPIGETAQLKRVYLREKDHHHDLVRLW